MNLSESGVFIATNSPCSIGTLITVELPLDDRWVRFEGEVRTTIKVDPMLRQWKQSGMGVRLLSTEERMRQIMRFKSDGDRQSAGDRNHAPPATPASQAGGDGMAMFSINLDSPLDLAEVFDSHIRHGGIFVPTSAGAERDDPVHLQFLFRWSPETLVQTSGKVVQTFPGRAGAATVDGATGIGVAFSDPQETIAHFRQLLDAPQLPEATAERP